VVCSWSLAARTRDRRSGCKPAVTKCSSRSVQRRRRRNVWDVSPAPLYVCNLSDFQAKRALVSQGRAPLIAPSYTRPSVRRRHQPREDVWVADRSDPNNALFFTMACMIITARYHASIDPDLLPDIRQAMVIAMKGDSRRQGGVNGDNIYPAYSNVRTAIREAELY